LVPPPWTDKSPKSSQKDISDQKKKRHGSTEEWQTFRYPTNNGSRCEEKIRLAIRQRTCVSPLENKDSGVGKTVDGVRGERLASPSKKGDSKTRRCAMVVVELFVKEKAEPKRTPKLGNKLPSERRKRNPRTRKNEFCQGAKGGTTREGKCQTPHQ